MNTKELNSFIAVYEEMSINAAASRLFITPQGLSQIIKRMEIELGVDLFIRTNSGVTPTNYGIALYKNARSIIDELNTIKNITRIGENIITYNLSVASTLGVIDYLTVRFIKEFKERHKNINLRITEVPDRYVKDQITSGEAEIGFLAGPIDTTVFNAIPFTKHRHCLVINKSHPLSQKERITYKDLDNEPIALEGRDFSPYHNNMNRFVKAGSTPIVIMETTEINLTHKIADMNEGIGLSVDFPAWNNQYPNTVIRPFADLNCTWETFIVSKNNRIFSEAATLFKDFSLNWLKAKKQELFKWPKEYDYLNDWYKQ